jgi:hypothetical protein
MNPHHHGDNVIPPAMFDAQTDDSPEVPSLPLQLPEEDLDDVGD